MRVSIEFIVCAISSAEAAVKINLNSASTFGILGSTSVTNTGLTIINGDLGLYPGTSITGFNPPGIVNGNIYQTVPAAQQAQTDALMAYNQAVTQPCDIVLTGQDLGAMTLSPGVYCFDSTAQLTGALTFDGQGDASAVFIVRIGTALTTAQGASVLPIGAAQACNIVFAMGSAVTFGAGTVFTGSVLAQAGIALTAGASNNGLLASLFADVTMIQNTVNAVACAAVQSTSSQTTAQVTSSTLSSSLATSDTSTINPASPTDASLIFSSTDSTSSVPSGTISAIVEGSSVMLDTNLSLTTTPSIAVPETATSMSVFMLSISPNVTRITPTSRPMSPITLPDSISTTIFYSNTTIRDTPTAVTYALLTTTITMTINSEIITYTSTYTSPTTGSVQTLMSTVDSEWPNIPASLRGTTSFTTGPTTTLGTSTEVSDVSTYIHTSGTTSMSSVTPIPPVSTPGLPISSGGSMTMTRCLLAIGAALMTMMLL